ncbi:MAG: hypothetical protein LBJ44_00515 [Propionibacteriaceae bacterium]|nr:hypothetical protein [Propionibacteriaceae bacterium]
MNDDSLSPAAVEPPPTGDAVIDAALAQVADLSQVDLLQHPIRLAQAHQILRASLQGAPLDDLVQAGSDQFAGPGPDEAPGRGDEAP